MRISANPLLLFIKTSYNIRMKTAMQEWFDELKANYPYMANEIYQKGFEKYLEKEKE